jgi:hypothetical protein
MARLQALGKHRTILIGAHSTVQDVNVRGSVVGSRAHASLIEKTRSRYAATRQTQQGVLDVARAATDHDAADVRLTTDTNVLFSQLKME